MALKTPGVYIEEIATFPPSVVAVETAVPAFIGYTEKALDEDGKSLSFIPTRIKSLLEFEEYFGGDYDPDRYHVNLDPANGYTVTAVQPRNASNAQRRYYLYACLRHFYANGGGKCYIISIGSYSDDPDAGSVTPLTGLIGGLSRLERFDEPTLILYPDGVSLANPVDLGSVQVAALQQCAKLQDRFTIMDLMNGNLAQSISDDPVGDFRDNNGTSHLKYGAAYYPWLNTIYKPEVLFNQLQFFNTADTAISNNDIDSIYSDITKENSLDALTKAARGANTNVASIVSTIDISAMSALTLDRNNIGQLMEHYNDLTQILRLTSGDVPATREAFENLVLLARATGLAFEVLRSAAFSDELGQLVTDLTADTSLINAIIELVALEKNSGFRAALISPREIPAVEADYSSLNGTPWILDHVDVTTIEASTVNLGTTVYDRAMNGSAALEPHMTKLATAFLSVFESAEYLASESEKQLFSRHPIFAAVLQQINKVIGLLPCSGAVAGIYASVDRTRGVWKAPANASIADISGPAVKINDETQGDLNVHTSGKSINAIRAFTGKGTIIWGARTLDGNSNEWRYVPVRRFFNMAEESIKKATEPFTFEPNDANTWVRVRAMIENFLTIQWRNGALAGATTQQAFYVKVGLGETMTSQDILEGRMILEIGMAVVRPAEFIVLKFAHKMQVS